MTIKIIGYSLIIDREGDEENLFCQSEKTLLYSIQSAIVRWGFDPEISPHGIKEIKDAWDSGAPAALIKAWQDWDTTDLCFSFSVITLNSEAVVEPIPFPDVTEIIRKPS